jgi:hypothetical protein
MSRGLRSAIGGAIMLAASMLAGTRNTWSQEQQPPDLQMLLNLDLFSAPAGGTDSEGAPSGSLLDQLLALRQMGFLPSNPDQQPVPPSGHSPIDDLMPWILGPLEGNQ